ncbi:tail assembly chaperone [Latilactobacillus curvatus]|uniref:tail assembly chaperone n=1 Tax=Latilactobacillus curvatus TaxID=28038 RepID=UPI002030B2E7|nr:tail assembly chaperone [Latilactobacillus curvatus]MCM0724308.1 tail assembly chaperone [Latilactobacillus curvatus]
MNLTINGQEQELNFGVRFVRELDKVAGINKDGVQLGFGLTRSLPGMQTYNPATLSDVIYAATATNSPRPSRNDVDDYIDSIESIDELEKVFEEVNQGIDKANALKAALKNMKA